MPPRPRVAHPRHLVTAVLVAHDGARWLPTTLGALHAQTRAPQQVLAVDTGSTDGSIALLEEACGVASVVQRPRSTGFGDAVRAGLEAAQDLTREGPSGGVEWVWLLHDDSAPDPEALEALLDLAVESPSVAVIGPKCLTWDGEHLAEMGLTTDITGRRETGLERREVDHGQHDTVRDVLAVGSAGALIRRDLWDRLGGYDAALPLLRDDIDFGWRATLSGARVVVAPRAVVRHASALAAGLRRPDAAGGGFRRVDRRHAIRVLVTDLPAGRALLAGPRLALAALLRALGLLLFRRPAAAYDELAACFAVVGRPHAVFAARAARRPLRTRPPAEVRHLLAGPGVRMRHRGELLAELLAGRRPDLTDRRFRRRGVETGPVAEEAENLEVGGGGALRRLVRRPWFLLLAGLTVVALVAERHLLGGDPVGGRLLPTPGGAGDLWSTYAASWHPVGLGSTTTAPAYLAVVALLATALLGKAWLAVDLLVLGAVPLAGLSAFRAVRSVTASLRIRLWAAVAYALLPAVTGALAGGRLDVLGAAIVAPLAVAAFGSLLRNDPAVVGWHRPAGAGLLLAVTAAFLPVAYLVVGAAALIGAAVVARPARALAVVAGLVVPPLVLLPWTVDAIRHPTLLVAGAGLPEALARPAPVPAHDLLLLHAGGPAQPWLFVGLPLVLAGVVGLTRRDRWRVAAFPFAVAVAGLAAAVVAARTGVVAGRADVRAWAGPGVLLAGLGLTGAAAAGAAGIRAALARHAFGWRQPVTAVLTGLALVAPAIAGAEWLVRGADHPLRSGVTPVAPAFVLAEVATAQRPKAVVLRPRAAGVDYAVLRASGGLWLGDADVAPRHAGGTRGLDAVVRQLSGGGGTDVPATLAAYGVRLLVLPDATDPTTATLATTLDRTPGLTRTQSAGAAVWRVQAPAGRLVVLPPALARQAATGTVPSSTDRTAASLLAAGDEGAVSDVAPGAAGRLVVLAEPVGPAWRARLNGRRLPARTAYGWAQAFALPAGGGRLVVTREGSGRRLALGVEAGLVGLALLASMPAIRRREDEPEEAPL